jgi:hypothetical protein
MPSILLHGRELRQEGNHLYYPTARLKLSEMNYGIVKNWKKQLHLIYSISLYKDGLRTI